MQFTRQDRWAGVIIVGFLLAISLPFLAAQSVSNQQSVFSGFLFNPTDGYSYLAKMHQGYSGSWLFHLPFSPEPGEGAPLYLLYLSMGHVARLLGWSLIFTFHALRLLASTLLAFALYRFIGQVFPDSPWRLFAFVLALLGSGLGWLAAAAGFFTSDLWVAEAYPFLSSFANVHFPLGLAIQIWLLTPWRNPKPRWQGFVANFALAALLSIVNPFAWAVAIAVLAAWIIWLWFSKNAFHSEIARWAGAFLGGLPYAAHSVWLVNTHPQLTESNLQNVALTPAPLDLLVAFSPALLFAVLALPFALRSKPSGGLRLVLTWLLVGAIIVWIPVSFQRRLLSGFFVPVAILAAFALSQEPFWLGRKKWLPPLLFAFSLPSLLLVVLGSFALARGQEPQLVTYTQELNVFSWLIDNAQQSSLILASPQTSLRLPAYTDDRVMYAHPFETIQASERESEVLQFYSGDMELTEAEAYLEAWEVDFVFYGPREQALGAFPSLPGWRMVYQTDETQLWAPEPPDG